MSETTGSQFNFVYVVHDDEFGEATGKALLGDSTPPDLVDLEWSRIGRTREEAKTVIPILYEDLKCITDPKSTAQQVANHMAHIDKSPFHRSLLAQLVGTGIEVVPIDVFEDAIFGLKLRDFNSVEMTERLTAVIADDRLSLEKRKQELVAITQVEADFNQKREHAVLVQLAEMAKGRSLISVFQGLGHQAVADLISSKGIVATKTFIPTLEPWPAGDPVTDEEYVPQLSKLSRMIDQVDNVADIPEIVIERALLAEFIRAYITRSTVHLSETVNDFGQVVAASRIVEGLSEEKVRSKLRAAVKVCTKGGSMAQVLKPLMPKHSLRSFSPPGYYKLA